VKAVPTFGLHADTFLTKIVLTAHSSFLCMHDRFFSVAIIKNIPVLKIWRDQGMLRYVVMEQLFSVQIKKFRQLLQL